MTPKGETAVKRYRPAPAPEHPQAGKRPPVAEIGGRRDGTEPTRFGDWEKNGRCVDF